MQLQEVDDSSTSRRVPLASNGTLGLSASRDVEFCQGDEDDIAGVTDTFFIMQHRKDRRMREGRFRVHSNVRMVTDAINFLIFSLITFRIIHIVHPQLIHKPPVAFPIALTVGLILNSLYSVWKVPEHIHSMLVSLQLILCVLWLIYEYDPRRHDCYWEDFCLLPVEKTIVGTFGITISLTFLSFLIFQYIGPLLNRSVCWTGSAASWWFRIRRGKPDDFERRRILHCFRRKRSAPQASQTTCPPNACFDDGWQTFAYWPHGWFSIFTCCSRRCFRYKGSVDEEGRPHGFGRWHDNHFHGEYLQGIWEHGKPVGGFRSRAFGTSAQTMQRPIGYVTSRADSKKARYCPKRMTSVRHGVLQVELSRAGGFFSFLPCAGRHLPCNNVAEVKQKLAVGICPDDKGNASEALVFIHGFNISLDEAISRLGQLIVLGGLDKNVDPYVFSYSAGATFSYFEAKAQMHEYGPDIESFLNDLGGSYSKVHIVAHSCGAHFLCVNWDRCWKTPRHWNLATLTFVNPDVVMEIAQPVIQDMVDADHHVTIYVDENDQALWFSWALQVSMPRCITKQELKQPVQLLGLTLEFPHTGFGRSDSFTDAASFFPDSSQIDIINCSDIEQNVHNLRHCYYSINTQMVADICEVVSEGKRASERSRLACVPQRGSTIFTFACPPGGYVPD